ncbi:FimV/HubP family polar landmark protein [Alishewanella sp. d11]|uniref:FimV/HubP family polar landmark protein n=1 Tax=Alishewanella sp. d11 TaxID=3414030 RepID=UPI003BF8E65A
MPVLLVLLLLFVNFSPMVLADTAPTQIRGPKSADSVLLQKQFGPLTATDTLWRIAEQVKPSNSVSTYQVMYAIFVKNPQAFNDNNFNHLRPGSVLLVPDLREIRAVDPEVAKRKAELDDELWTQKIAREAAERAKAREAASKPNAIQQQTVAELNALKDQYQDSMQLIAGIAQENANLRGSLSRVEQELEGLKAQLSEDSLLQQQLNQLLQQQQQMLEEQQAAKAAEEAAKLAQAAESSFSNLLNNPIVWVIAASAPAILLLLGGIFWLKRRGRKTEEVVAAAIKEPSAVSGYKSPLPPLEASQDFDDSLFDIDDSLLSDSFSTEEKPKTTTATTKSDLDDELPDFSDDIVLDDLGDDDPLQSTMLDKGTPNDFDINLDDDFSNPQDEAALALDPTEEINFDANNILSDMDLSALLMAEDDADDVIELADPEKTEAADLLAESSGELAEKKQSDALASSLTDQDDIDSLLEEIELDLPIPAEAEQSIDDLLAQHTISEHALEPASAPALEDENHSNFDTVDVDELLEQEQLMVSDEHFDNSDLDEFAEQLASEIEQENEAAYITEDEQLLNAEMDDILDQAAEQQISALDAVAADEVENKALTEQADVVSEETLDEALSEQTADIAEETLDETLSEQTADIAEETLDETLSEQTADIAEEALDETLPKQTADIAEEALDEALLEQTADIAEETLDETPTEQADTSLAALSDMSSNEALDDVLIDEPTAIPSQDKTELTLDLTAEEDNSVIASSEAALAVENPSKVLDTYPDLDLDEFDPEEAFDFSTENIANLTDDADLEVLSGALEEELPASPEVTEDNFPTLDTELTNLSDLDDSQFDDLLNELEGISVIESAEEGAENEVPTQLEADVEEEPALSDADFVEIDNLLQAMEQTEEDADRFNNLNVDVGLDEFADIIGEHNKMDVDQEDEGFAGKLDLIRAYIEMDEPESAALLIDEVLTSAAPEHVKEEAKALKPD